MLESPLAVPTPTVGVVTKLDSSLQISATTMPGSSGSPIMLTDGTVVGVSSGIYRANPNFGLAVPASNVLALLETLRNP